MFYVYEHWRTDRDECFYVGKGKNNRAYNMSRRNPYHKAIRAKVEREGYAVEVRIVESGLTEEAAYKLEQERILFWRQANIEIANFTDGGEGSSGKKFSPESIQKMKDSSKKRWENPSNRLHASKKTKEFIDSHPDFKMMISSLAKGRKHTEEQKAKISAALKGKKKSPDHIAKVAAKQIGNKKGMGNKSHTGLKISEETRQKMILAQKLRRANEKQEA